MVPSATKSAVTVRIEDEEALNRAVIEVAARAIESLVQDTPQRDDRKEFKLAIRVNGRSCPAFLGQVVHHKDGSISADATAVVFASPVEGTQYLIDLNRSEQKWSAKLNMTLQISSD